MADRTVAAKLLLKPGGRLWVSDPGRASLAGPLPDGARVVDAPGPGVVALVIADDAATARAVVTGREAGLGAALAFWVAYPKGGRSDINRDTLWPVLAQHGFRPIGQVALDEAWSALRFRVLAPGEAPFNPRS